MRLLRCGPFRATAALFLGLVAWRGGPLAAQPSALPASSSERVVKHRNLVLCLDGTWNGTYDLSRRDDGSGVVKPTNVLKLCRSVVPWDPVSQTEQIAYYDIGVGALSHYPGSANHLLYLADRVLGGAWGAGFEGNIEDALGFLALNYRPGDDVYIFGFSRGAATARGLTRFLDWAGGIPEKGDAYYLPILFREFVQTRGAAGAATRKIECINHPAADCGLKARRSTPRSPCEGPPADRGAECPRSEARLRPLVPVPVQFLGVWDTVYTLGSRFRGAHQGTSTPTKTFYVDTKPADCVKNARQALAVDEARYDFRAEIWTEVRAGQTLAQRWFPGVHSNIGGGYPNDGLANGAFQWILGEARANGLHIDESFSCHYRPYPLDELYRSDSLLYRKLDFLRHGDGIRCLFGNHVNLTLDPSVIRRIVEFPERPCDKPPYRPENVLRFLACQPDLEKYLTQIGIEERDRNSLKEVLAPLRFSCPKDPTSEEACRPGR